MKNSTLLHIPHASTVIPPQYLSSFESSKLSHEIAVMTDWFCDELFDCCRDKIVFPVSRLVCDVERFRDDKDEIMAQIGMGVTYRSTSDLQRLRNITKTERAEILIRYYDVHHEAFTNAVRDKLDTFGHCLIIDCHSFYPIPLPYEICQQEDRPDFCIGTSVYHTPVSITNALCATLESKGFTVSCNSPFAGTIVPIEFYEKNPNVFSVMIEINRRLYMDSTGNKNNDFKKINSIVKECVKAAENVPEK